MPTPFQTALAVASCLASCVPSWVRAAEAQPALIAPSTQVAGQHLQLNGTGISTRMLFKIYTVGLYLRDQRRTTEAVLSSDGPRRLVIRLMRDITAEEFEAEVLAKLAQDITRMDARVAEQMSGLSQALVHLPSGLRRGDLLTLDLIPGTGTVIEHNRRRVLQPLPDMAFYNTLLNFWLGEQAADPQLKTALLGQS